MELKELSKLVSKITQRIELLAVKKNKDYSHDSDVHSNFLEVSALCNLLLVDVGTPQGCIQYEIVKKIHGMFKLVRDAKTPENESLFDNTVDINVYIALLLGLNEVGKE